MHFDASPKTLKGLHTLLRKDPRVIRWTMLKEGEKVEDVVELKEQTIDHSSPYDSVSSVSTASPVSLRALTTTHTSPPLTVCELTNSALNLFMYPDVSIFPPIRVY